MSVCTHVPRAIQELTDDLTEEQLQLMLTWMFIGAMQVNLANIKRWRKDAGLPETGWDANLRKG